MLINEEGNAGLNAECKMQNAGLNAELGMRNWECGIGNAGLEILN